MVRSVASMRDRKVKNPLQKRIPRELKGDWKKYLVVALFLILTIGFVSGMYVANGSMMQAAVDGKEKYCLEDGHFELNEKADQELIHAIETGEKAVPVTVYENFYRSEVEDHDNDGKSDGTIRVYEKTEDINLACLMEGSFPETEEEIAIDRMHADNAGIQVGDTISVSEQSYQVTGLISYVNYSTLHEKSTDLMFDALKFNVAMVTKDGFERLSGSLHYTYAWRYEQEPMDEIEEKKQSDDFMRALLTQTVMWDNELQDYLPRYANPAVNFATDDMGSDEAMGGVLLDILIVIIYMMQHTPLQFLRRDLKKTRRKKTIRLPKWKFFSRFRLRIIFQNMPNYAVLFAGIFFVMVMLAMAVGMPSTLKYYQDHAENLMFAKYQYVLKSCEDEEGQMIQTDVTDAEQFCMKALKKTGDALDEEVSVYGVKDDSKYIRIEDLASLKENEVYLSRPFIEKYNLKVGDVITLDEKYEYKQYQFKVAGIYEKCQNIAVFSDFVYSVVSGPDLSSDEVDYRKERNGNLHDEDSWL